MPTPPNLALLSQYRDLFNWRKNFNNAVKLIEEAYGRSGQQPGSGVQETSRTFTEWDFQVGAATGATSPIAQDIGAGAWRHSHYHEREGILTFAVSVPLEEEEAMTPELDREIDQKAAEIYARYMECMSPFVASGDFLPMYDIEQIIDIEPDERPEEMREVNVQRIRFRIRFTIRKTAWPT